MSAELGRAVYELSTDSSKFDAGMDRAQTKSAGLTKAVAGVSATTRIMTGVMAGSAAGALSQWAQAAADDEASTIRLAQAIENTGVSFEESSDAIEERIKLGQSLAFSDDETRKSMTLLVAATGSVDEAMKRNALAMDLARGTGMSLEAASKLLGKVTDENVGVLKRYGITVAEGAGETELFAEVQKRFGGQAEAYGNTTSAAIAKTKDAIGEWQESIGAALGPAGQYIAMLPGITAGMQLAGGAAGAFMPKIVALTASVWGMIPALVAAALPFAPIIIAVAAVGAAVLALKFAWENNLGDIQGKAQAVLGFLTNAFETFKSFFVGLWRSLPGPVQGAVDMILAPIRSIISLAQTALEWIGRVTGARVPAPSMTAPSTGGYVPSVVGGGSGGYINASSAPVVIDNRMTVEVDGRAVAVAVDRATIQEARLAGVMS